MGIVPGMRVTWEQCEKDLMCPLITRCIQEGLPRVTSVLAHRCLPSRKFKAKKLPLKIGLPNLLLSDVQVCGGVKYYVIFIPWS